MLTEKQETQWQALDKLAQEYGSQITRVSWEEAWNKAQMLEEFDSSQTDYDFVRSNWISLKGKYAVQQEKQQQEQQKE
jgi:hypothetical protein